MGWSDWERVEKVQGRYVKMALGLHHLHLHVNTPNYIWEMEADRDKIGVNSFIRAGRYLIEIGRMKESRWPRICLKEEIRALENGEPTKWGKVMAKAFERVGDGGNLKNIFTEEDRL